METLRLLNNSHGCLLTFSKTVTVNKVVLYVGSCLSFRRCLWGDLALAWNDLFAIIQGTSLSSINDSVSWKLDRGKFSVKSMHNSLQTRQPKKVYKQLWKLKLPGKIKIFLWLVLWGRILTKDNLVNKGWIGDHHCMFCAGDETIGHLFFRCPLAIFVWGVLQVAFDTGDAPRSMDQVGEWMGRFRGVDLAAAKIFLSDVVWTLWKTRNRAYFDHIIPADPVGVIFQVCHWLDFWCDLQKPKVRRGLQAGAKLMRKVACKVFNRSKGWAPAGRRITA